MREKLAKYNFLKFLYYKFLFLAHIFFFQYYKVFPLDRWKNYHFLEIGAGSARKPGWLSLDYVFGCDLFYNLNNKLPFNDNHFDRIYSSHVLEHFNHYSLTNLLKELHRVLVEGGTMDICVPDASIYINAYISGDPKDLLQFKPAIISNCKMDILNYIFYMNGEHKFMFDYDNLSYQLKLAGFKNIKIRQFDPHIDDFERLYESMYLVCEK